MDVYNVLSGPAKHEEAIDFMLSPLNFTCMFEDLKIITFSLCWHLNICLSIGEVSKFKGKVVIILGKLSSNFSILFSKIDECKSIN